MLFNSHKDHRQYESPSVFYKGSCGRNLQVLRNCGMRSCGANSSFHECTRTWSEWLKQHNGAVPTGRYRA